MNEDIKSLTNSFSWSIQNALNQDKYALLSVFRTYGSSMPPEVLSNIVDKYQNSKVLILVLTQCDQINQSVYNKIANIVLKQTTPDDALVKKLLEQEKFLTADIFDKFVDKSLKAAGVDLIRAVLSSPFCNENTCIKIIDGFKSKGYSTELMLYEIINSNYCTSKVVDEILKISPDQLTISWLLKSPTLTKDQFERVYKLIDKDKNSEWKRTVLDSPNVSKQMLIDILSSVDRSFIASNKEKIIAIPACDSDIIDFLDPYADRDCFVACPSTTADQLKKVVESYFNRVPSAYDSSFIDSVINHPSTNAEVIDLIVTKYLGALEKFSRTTSIKVLTELIGNQYIEESHLTAILNQFSNSEIKEAIAKSPKAGKDVKLQLILNGNLTDYAVKSYFDTPGLTVDDIVKIIEHRLNDNVLDAALNYKGLNETDNNKIYKTLIDTALKNASVTNSAVINKIIQKEDVSENILIDIIKYDHSISNIEAAIKKPNAGLKLVSAILAELEKIRSDNDRAEVEKLAWELKKSIISKNFKVEEEQDVTEMLRRNVEDGMSTMLWGPSGVGKSSRVFEIDPTATMLILKNGMLPEEVVGGKEPNGAPGQIYPPHWYNLLCQKCNDEPNRMHILFIDEFTNVSDTIKNLVWEVVGYRLVAGHEEWQLPPNCAIVAAGNRPEESSAVRIDNSGGVMPAPLHNRVDSMIEIEFSIDEWSRWALETDPNTGKLRVHPIVYSFCVANADKVMFTQYNPEDVTKPFLTPRKWEALSRAIYSAEKRNGGNTLISEARLNSIIGNNDISMAFFAHYLRMPIDMEKVAKLEYTVDDFPTVEDKLYALGMLIAKYDGDPMAVESFIVDCLGDEYLSVYESMKSNKKAVSDSTVEKQGGVSHAL